MFKRKILSVLLIVLATFCLFSCGGGTVECSILETNENRVVISVIDTDGKATVTNCMEYLKGNTDFSYKISGGMVTEINGKANTADFSGCWLLYTSDTDMANAEWGTIEYNGETLGSAILGAESLIVEKDEIYVWEYVTF